MGCGGALNPGLLLPAAPRPPAPPFCWDFLTPLSLGCFRWEQVVDLTYSLRLGAKPKPMEQDEAAVEKLRYELFASFCRGWLQAAVSPWLLRQLSPAAQGERGEDGRRGTALLGAVLS